MNQSRISTAAAPIDFDAIRTELGIPEKFPDAVDKAAVAAVDRGPLLAPDRADRTELEFVTLDPVGSKDLDQAVLIQRSGPGYRVFYAIADVAAWVDPGGPIEVESFARGVTLYSPDHSTPLHPLVLSEGGASLLPDVRRPAVLWTIELDAAGKTGAVQLERAWVRSRAKLDYTSAQQALDAGTLHPSIALLAEVGRLRQDLARQRHAITLDLPDIEVFATSEVPGAGDWRLGRRALLPIEQYNAEISLLTGMAAASIMLDGGVGILRTLPAPNNGQIAALRRATAALGIPWPPGTPPGDIVAQLDGDDPKQAAFLEHAARLLRGAGYFPFNHAAPPRTDVAFDHTVPSLTDHAGVGAPYAHVTAPLRRLVDRFGTEICLALTAGKPEPDWVTSRLEELPKVMAAADQKANRLEKACIGAVGAFLLAGREGELFEATVLLVDREQETATVVLTEPPVRAKCDADGLAEGDTVQVELVSADPTSHTYRVRLAPAA